MRKYLILAAAALLALACNAPRPADDYLVAAYVWPSCHDDSLAHHYLWPEGIGEWEVIKQGDPRFEGHYQPKRPLWGYEMDDDPLVVERWIHTALDHGINTLVYDWYWFKEFPYLEGALNDGFLKAKNCRQMNFYIMWANHDVKYNYWNYHIHGDNTDLLFNPDVDWPNFKIVVDRIIKQYFCQPNYVKFDGRPVMAIFSMDNLIRSFGSMEETAKAFAYFRDEARKAGYPDIFLMETFGGAPKLGESNIPYQGEKIEKLGLDAVSFYNMGGFDVDYEKHCANSVGLREAWEQFGVPVFPCVSIGWDDTPRFPAKGAKDVTQFNHSPEVFAKYLKIAKEYADAHPSQPRLIHINAMNEWVEGSYLLPDEVTGYGYFEAVKSVMGTAHTEDKIARINYKEWKLDWSDEFDGTELDTTAWSRCQQGTSDWDAHMSPLESLVEVHDGMLSLKAVCTPGDSDEERPVITGGVQSNGKKSMQLGMFEVRARLGCAKGFWPAIWLLPDGASWPGGGEIDMVEHLNHDYYCYQTIHTAYTLDNPDADQRLSHARPTLDRDGWNTYSAVVEQDAVKLYVNGEEWMSYARMDPEVENQFPFADNPYYVILSAQLGGNWVGEIDPSELPVQMDIDYVRFYKKK